jgi:formylglycine-generating enzyme required for sulfatase activity
MKEKASLKIFLAHAREDENRVRELYQRLKTQGYSPWLDKVDLMPGQQWREEIPKAIHNSSIFLACLSQSTLIMEGYIQNEFRLALEQAATIPKHEIYIIPVKFDECELPTLEVGGINLGDFQWVNYWEEGAFTKLEAALEYKRGLLEVATENTVAAQYAQAEGKPSEYKEGTALEIWRDKLAYFRAQEAITADAAQKFELDKRIRECVDKIRELEGGEEPQVVERDVIREFRQQVREYLGKRYIEPFEMILLTSLREELHLTPVQAEAIIKQEEAPILRAREEYKNNVLRLIEQGHYPFSQAINTELGKIKTKKNLTDWEVEEITAPIFEEQEGKQRDNLASYEQVFRTEVNCYYPLQESQRYQLEELQKSLGLKNAEVEQIESPIIQAKNAEIARREEEEKQERERIARLKREEARAVEAERGRRAQEERQERVRIASLRREEEYRERMRITRRKLIQISGGLALGGGGVILVSSLRNTNRENPVIKLQEITQQFETVRVNSKGVIIAREKKQARTFLEDLGNGVKLEMVYIPAGKFLMGTDNAEIERLVKKFGWEGFRREAPQHEVTVSAFWMSKYPITQEQWRAVAGLGKVKIDLKPEPGYFKGKKRPVERVNWSQAVEYGDRLAKLTGRKYKLPSEAQWEYACRGGTKTAFAYGETLTTELANYDGNYTFAEEGKGIYRGETTEVGKFYPNPFGLYDMHGNVWEWCEDDWHENYENAPVDGSAWLNKNNSQQENSIKILRGGSWFDNPRRCRSAFRDLIDARDWRDDHRVGFRLVCPPQDS